MPSPSAPPRPHPASAAARTNTSPAAPRSGPTAPDAAEEVLVPFNCRLPVDVRRALKRHAAEHDTRIQDIVAAALRDYYRET